MYSKASEIPFCTDIENQPPKQTLQHLLEGKIKQDQQNEIHKKASKKGMLILRLKRISARLREGDISKSGSLLIEHELREIGETVDDNLIKMAVHSAISKLQMIRDSKHVVVDQVAVVPQIITSQHVSQSRKTPKLRGITRISAHPYAKVNPKSERVAKYPIRDDYDGLINLDSRELNATRGNLIEAIEKSATLLEKIKAAPHKASKSGFLQKIQEVMNNAKSLLEKLNQEMNNRRTRDNRIRTEPKPVNNQFIAPHTESLFRGPVITVMEHPPHIPSSYSLYQDTDIPLAQQKFNQEVNNQMTLKNIEPNIAVNQYTESLFSEPVHTMITHDPHIPSTYSMYQDTDMPLAQQCVNQPFKLEGTVISGTSFNSMNSDQNCYHSLVFQKSVALLKMADDFFHTEINGPSSCDQEVSENEILLPSFERNKNDLSGFSDIAMQKNFESKVDVVSNMKINEGLNSNHNLAPSNRLFSRVHLKLLAARLNLELNYLKSCINETFKKVAGLQKLEPQTNTTPLTVIDTNCSHISNTPLKEIRPKHATIDFDGIFKIPL